MGPKTIEIFSGVINVWEENSAKSCKYLNRYSIVGLCDAGTFYNNNNNNNNNSN